MPLFFTSGPQTRIFICLFVHPVLLEAGEAVGRGTRSDATALALQKGKIKTYEEAAQQIVEDSSLSSRVDELYYEDHVHMHPFMHGGPWQGGKNRTKRTLIDSYALFGQLRRIDR